MQRASCFLLLLFLGAAPLVAADRQLSEERAQELLKRFPRADTNKDGKLSLEEARAFRDRKPKNKAEKLAQLPAPTQADVSYGPAERNVFDFYQAKSDRPTPLIIYIHGGGFVHGDKRSLNAATLERAHASGISVAALNYRFVNGGDVIFPAPQRDCARALQFLRSKANDWNIDPARVACFGGSAGAGISMWLGFHDDLADPNSSDPIARESTRISAIGTTGGQATYDPIKIKELIGGRAWEHPSLLKVYGLSTTEQALNPTPEMQKLYDEGSAITHLTKDDPPLFMVYSEADAPLPAGSGRGRGIHHPRFGHLLEQEMNKLGIKNVYVHIGGPERDRVQNDMLAFFKEAFGMSGSSKSTTP